MLDKKTLKELSNILIYGGILRQTNTPELSCIEDHTSRVSAIKYFLERGFDTENTEHCDAMADIMTCESWHPYTSDGSYQDLERLVQQILVQERQRQQRERKKKIYRITKRQRDLITQKNKCRSGYLIGT